MFKFTCQYVTKPPQLKLRLCDPIIHSIVIDWSCWGEWKGCVYRQHQKPSCCKGQSRSQIQWPSVCGADMAKEDHERLQQIDSIISISNPHWLCCYRRGLPHKHWHICAHAHIVVIRRSMMYVLIRNWFDLHKTCYVWVLIWLIVFQPSDRCLSL